MEILKRLGVVLGSTLFGVLAFAVIAVVFGLAQRLLSGQEIDNDAARRIGEGAAVIGFGWGGALGALSGGAAAGDMFRAGGTDSLAGDGPSSVTPAERRARLVSWAFAIALAAFCFWRLTQA